MARSLKRAPKDIAFELRAAVGEIEGVSAIEIAGNGYLNLRLDRGYYASGLLAGVSERDAVTDGKIIVEHTNINPNKAAHIGHLRNAILAIHSCACCARRFIKWKSRTTSTTPECRWPMWWWGSGIWRTNRTMRCGADRDDAVRLRLLDVYARISSYYDDHAEAKSWRHDMLHAIEAGTDADAELAHLVADAIVKTHLATMWRLASSTTCCRERARSCICISGRRRLSC